MAKCYVSDFKFAEEWLDENLHKPLSQIIKQAKENLTTSERARLLIAIAQKLSVNSDQIVKVKTEFAKEA